MQTKRFLIAGLLLFSFFPKRACPQKADQLIQQYQLQLVRGANTADAWALLGYAFMQKARESSDPAWSDSAEATLAWAYQLDSSSARVNKYLAMSKGARHEFRQAIKHALSALAAKPNDAHTLGLIGDAYLELGSPDSARQYYSLMDSAAPPDLASYARWAHFWWQTQGKRDSARACYARAEKLAKSEENPAPENLAWLCVTQGELNLLEGDFNRADSFYRAALEYLPDYPMALEHTAEIQLIEKRFDEAIELYRKATALSENPGLVIFLGDAFEKAGRNDSAKPAWQKGEAAYRRLIEAGNNGYLRPLAEFYLARGNNLQKALELARKDLTIRQDFGAYLTLGRAYLQLGRKKEALAAVQQASVIAENDPQFCYYAGEIYLANGDREKAKELFAKANQLCPQFDLVFGTDLATKLASLSKKEALHN